MRPVPPRLTMRPTQRIGLGPPPQGTDPYLHTKEHRKWSAAVLRRANYQCEDPQHDPRYPRSGIRLHADHVVERRDGGPLTDPNNGLARCTRCHTTKSLRERAKRMAQ